MVEHSKGNSKEVIQAHPLMPTKIDSTTYPSLMRDLWAPSMEIATDGLNFLLDKFDWALTERKLAAFIVPFGIDTGMQVAFDVTYLNFSDYDRRAEILQDQEPADEEPVSYFKDSYIPKNAAFRSDYTGINRSLNGQQSMNRFSIAEDQRSHTIRTRKGAQSIVGKDLDETSFGGGDGKTESTGNRTIEQVGLQPNVKDWEKMTKQEEYELEFMRMNQIKKELLRQEQAKKALQRQVSVIF